MKKVEAIIRPMKLEAVKAALAEEAGIVGMTVSDVRGFSSDEYGFADPVIRASARFGALSPKVKIEMVVRDGDVQPVIDTLLAYARTGAPGDGKIFVLDIEDALRIRTSDCGDRAVG